MRSVELLLITSALYIKQMIRYLIEYYYLFTQNINVGYILPFGWILISKTGVLEPDYLSWVEVTAANVKYILKNHSN